jgi:hypothetical protein
LDEAQFLGRRVRIAQTERSGDIEMRLSLNPDSAAEMALTNPAALTLLDGLGIDRKTAGMVPMTELRQRLMDPRIRRRLDADPALSESVQVLATMAGLKPADGEYLWLGSNRPITDEPTARDAQPHGWRVPFFLDTAKPASPRSRPKREWPHRVANPCGH